MNWCLIKFNPILNNILNYPLSNHILINRDMANVRHVLGASYSWTVSWSTSFSCSRIFWTHLGQRDGDHEQRRRPCHVDVCVELLGGEESHRWLMRRHKLSLILHVDFHWLVSSSGSRCRNASNNRRQSLLPVHGLIADHDLTGEQRVMFDAVHHVLFCIVCAQVARVPDCTFDWTLSEVIFVSHQQNRNGLSNSISRWSNVRSHRLAAIQASECHLRFV